MKKVESFLRWVSIVLFTVLAIFVTVPVLAMIQNAALRKMNPFTLMVLAAVLLWFIVVRFLFQDFYVRGQLSGGIKRFYELILAHPIQATYSLLRKSLNTLTRRLILAGVLIVGLVVVATKIPQLEIIGWNILTRPFAPNRQAVAQPPPHTRYLTLLTGDNNRREYLRACLKIAKDLKEAGARVAIFELPGIPQTEENIQLLAEIDATGIVVFGVRPYESIWRFAPAPLAGKTSLSWGVFTQEKQSSMDSPFIQRFKPYGYYRTQSKVTVEDVAITAVRKFRGIGEDIPIVLADRETHTGVGTLTVDAEGTLYSLQPTRFYRSTLPIVADLYTEQKGLRYRFFPTRPFPSTAAPPPAKEIDSFLPVEDLVRDKIVLVPWLEWYGGPGNPEVFAYIPLIEQMLSGQITQRLAEWDLFLALFLITISAALARWLRGLYSVPIMAIVGVAVFYGCVWLAEAQNILVNPAPALLAAVLSLATFPVVRFAWTMRAAEPMPSFVQEAEPVPAGHAAERPGIVLGRPATPDKRLSLSVRVAVLAIVLSISGSAAATYFWLSSQPKPQPEVIYIPTMPTIEVHGYYPPSNNSVQ
jgi:uncharacterized membrane protein